MLKKYGTLTWRLAVVLIMAFALIFFIRKGEKLSIIICSVLLALNLAFFIMVLLRHISQNKQEQ